MLQIQISRRHSLTLRSSIYWQPPLSSLLQQTATQTIPGRSVNPVTQLCSLIEAAITSARWRQPRQEWNSGVQLPKLCLSSSSKTSHRWPLLTRPWPIMHQLAAIKSSQADVKPVLSLKFPSKLAKKRALSPTTQTQSSSKTSTMQPHQQVVK